MYIYGYNVRNNYNTQFFMCVHVQAYACRSELEYYYDGQR